MKFFRFAIALTILSAFFTACSEEENPIIPEVPAQDKVYREVTATFDTEALTRTSLNISKDSRISLNWEKKEELIIWNVESGTFGFYNNTFDKMSVPEFFRLSDSYLREEERKLNKPLLDKENHYAVIHDRSDENNGWINYGAQFKFPISQYYTYGSIKPIYLPWIARNSGGNIFKFSVAASVLCFRVKSEKETSDIDFLLLESASKKLSGTSKYSNNILGEPDGENYVLLYVSDSLTINNDAREFYVVVPSGTYGAKDLTFTISTKGGVMKKIIDSEYTFMEGKVYDFDLDFEPDILWSLPLSEGKNSAKEIVIETNVESKPEGAVDLDDFGLLWHVMDGTTLKIQTMGAKVKVGGNMPSLFSDCQYVESITGLDKLDLSAVRSCAGIFGGCRALKNIDLSTLDTSDVVDMGAMFAGCESLTGLDLTSFDTSNVTDMSFMFSGCTSLTSLDLSSFNTSNVTDMRAMFESCSALESLNLSTFNTSNVTGMGNMFFYCNALKNLDLSSFNTSNVTDMSAMFLDCESLTSLDLSSFDTSNVTDMGAMFQRCSALESLNLSTFDTSNVTDMGLMFQRCSALESLNLSTFDTSNVTDMGWMFNDCSALTSLDLSSFDTSHVTDMSLMFCSCSALTSLDLSMFNTSNVTALRWMFLGCSSLTSLDLSTFDTSNVTDMCTMFGGCSALKNLDLSSFDTSNVTDMIGMISGCTSLTSLDLSTFDTSNVTDMEGMFYDCSALKSLDLSTFDTSNVTNMCTMFEGCESLTNLDLSHFSTEKVTNMSFMFRECYKLRSLTLSNSFSPNPTVDKTSMFAVCGVYTDSKICTIYGVTDASVKNALREGTDFNYMKFDGE